MIAPSLARRMLLVGGVASFLSVRPGEAASLVATPPQSEGPFYPTSLPADLDNDLVQVRGQAAQAMGTVLHLEGRVLDASGQPLPGARVEVRSEDNVHFAARIVSPEFAGLRPIARHQRIYGILGERMGREIHAMSIEAMTPEESAGQG